MNYYELREIVKDIVPRRSVLENLGEHSRAFKEKGRKVNYKEFKLDKGNFVLQQKLLKKEQIDSFLNISVRAPHCIAEGQLIHTTKGDKPIELILIGDQIASYNEKEQNIEFEKVDSVYSSLREDIIEIETESGKIQVTSDHSIFTNKGWKLAKDLTDEDEILEME